MGKIPLLRASRMPRVCMLELPGAVAAPLLWSASIRMSICHHVPASAPMAVTNTCRATAPESKVLVQGPLRSSAWVKHSHRLCQAVPHVGCPEDDTVLSHLLVRDSPMFTENPPRAKHCAGRYDTAAQQCEVDSHAVKLEASRCHSWPVFGEVCLRWLPYEGAFKT